MTPLRGLHAPCCDASADRGGPLTQASRRLLVIVSIIFLRVSRGNSGARTALAAMRHKSQVVTRVTKPERQNRNRRTAFGHGQTAADAKRRSANAQKDPRRRSVQIDEPGEDRLLTRRNCSDSGRHPAYSQEVPLIFAGNLGSRNCTRQAASD